MTTTKWNDRARKYYDLYIKSEDGLYSVYKNPSVYKRRAWSEIVKDQMKDDGMMPCVLTHNTSFFTAGYEFMADGKFYFALYTPSKWREVYEL